MTESAAAHGQVFSGFAARVRPDIEATIERLLPPETTAPADLHSAMRYAMLPGGKRLRPVLGLVGCQVTGGDPQRALVPVTAIEFLHTYSLVHDDLPCMDDDDLRRGRPTTHKVFGEALAVLVGDALLTLAFEAVADGGADAVRALGRAAGSRGMVGGQAADMAAEGGAAEGGAAEGGAAEGGAAQGGAAEGRPAKAVGAASLSDVQWIHDHKTGALIAASLEIGAIAGGGDLGRLEALREYGRLLGRAFQVADDCLDRTGAAEQLGKRPGQDDAAGKLTYPAVLGLEASLLEAERLAGAAAALAERVCGASRSGGVESDVRLLQDVALFTAIRKA